MSGEIVLVTGAASGIGRATALAFAREGAKAVIVADVDEPGGTETAGQVARAGAENRFVRTDVSRAADVEALMRGILDAYGRLDVAVNNAGIEGRQAWVQEQTEADWDRVLDINAKGVWLGLRYELPPMIAQRSGAIVNVTSVAGLVGFERIAPYVASKHAIIGLTKAAALEVARFGIRVNAVAPGVIRTPMVDRFTAGKPEVEAAFVAMEPVGRLGTPEEIANAITWLASGAASFVTGETLVADGGLVAR